VRDPCASERKIGVMSGDPRIARTTISLGLFKLVLLRIFVQGPARLRVRVSPPSLVISTDLTSAGSGRLTMSVLAVVTCGRPIVGQSVGLVRRFDAKGIAEQR
jgi:hypothetical protein